MEWGLSLGGAFESLPAASAKECVPLHWTPPVGDVVEEETRGPTEGAGPASPSCMRIAESVERGSEADVAFEGRGLFLEAARPDEAPVVVLVGGGG